MLNTEMVGSYISKLRKERDWTQMELANQLNVSHQAVSKWERGESLPDLGTLVDLASMFNVTTDQLLSGGKMIGTKSREPFIQEIAGNNTEEAARYISQGMVKAHDLIEMAPLLKSSTLMELADETDEHFFTIEEIILLAPFIDQSTLGKLVSRFKERISLQDLAKLAPFIGWEAIAAQLTFLTKMEVDLGDPANLLHVIRLVPFMGAEADTLVKRMSIEKIEWQQIVQLAPFVEKDTLAGLLHQKKDEEPLSFQKLSQLAPFLQKEQLEVLLESLDEDERKVEDILKIAPFIGKEKLGEYLERLDPSKLTARSIAMLAPFTSKEALERLIEMRCE